MSFKILNNDLILKCRLCLNVEQEMNPLFEPIYEAHDENGSILISLAEVLKSVSNVELNECNYELKNICGSCTTTVLNFNNLMKVFQDTEEELKKLLSTIENENGIDITLDSTIENIIIESYNDENHVNEESCDSFNKTKTFDSCVLNNENKYDDEKHVPEFQQDNIQCSEVLTNNTSHLTNQHTVENETVIISKKYSCNECGDEFLMKLGFTHHMLQKHNICISEKSFDQYTSDIKFTVPIACSEQALKYVQKIPLQPKRQYQFQCQVCKDGFANKADLKLHYGIHKTIKCNQCGAAFIKNSYLKDHMLMHSIDKKYICDKCGKAFRYRNGLAVHKSIHFNHKPHICEACGQGFNARTTLLTHIRLKHSVDEKKFPCSECDLAFKVKSWLDKHFKRRHTNNRTKDFVCSVCGISYLNKTTLTRHMNDKHLGNGKRYSCHICEKSYTMKNKLFGHMQIKHGTV